MRIVWRVGDGSIFKLMSHIMLFHIRLPVLYGVSVPSTNRFSSSGFSDVLHSRRRYCSFFQRSYTIYPLWFSTFSFVENVLSIFSRRPPSPDVQRKHDVWYFYGIAIGFCVIVVRLRIPPVQGYNFGFHFYINRCRFNRTSELRKGCKQNIH